MLQLHDVPGLLATGANPYTRTHPADHGKLEYSDSIPIHASAAPCANVSKTVRGTTP